MSTGLRRGVLDVGPVLREVVGASGQFQWGSPTSSTVSLIAGFSSPLESASNPMPSTSFWTCSASASHVISSSSQLSLLLRTVTSRWSRHTPQGPLEL